MAVKLEKTKTMSGDSRYSIKLTVTEKTVTSADIADNSTRVDYKLEATKSSGSGYYSNSAVSTVKVTLDGTTLVNTKKTYDFRNSTPKTITLASGTHTIKHDPDGSKTIACSGYFKDGANSLGNATASGNLTLSQLHTPPVITGYSITETNSALTNIGVSNNQFVGYLSNKRINITYNLDEDTQYQSALVYFEGGSQIDWNNALPITVNFANFHPAPVNNNLNLCVSVTDDKNTTSYYSNTSGSTQTRQGLDSYAYVPYIIPTFNSSSNAKRDGQLTGKVKLNITGTYYNGEIGSGSSKVNQGGTYKPTIKYKFWKVGESQPSTYAYTIPDSSITTSNGTFTISNYQIGSTTENATNYFNPSYSYRVKIYIQDTFKSTESPELSIPVGEAVWTEYKDRVDFKKLTIQNVEVTPGGGGAGDYENLINKPEINGVILSGDKTPVELGFSAVATSGNYNDLTNKPTIPTVNNATLTIQKNGTTVNSFTANANSNVTANITVPTKTSELTNDSNYITNSSLSSYVAKTGDTMTGKLTVPQIETGTGADNYFQNRKFRGEGNAGQYYHAIDFGYSGHNQVDLYEYGGVWNFWKNTTSTATTDTANLCLGITQTALKNKGYTYTFPNKTGTFAMASDIPTNTNQLTNGAGFITSSGSITGNAATATKATGDKNGNDITTTYVHNDMTPEYSSLYAVEDSDYPNGAINIVDAGYITHNNYETFISSGAIMYYKNGNHELLTDKIDSKQDTLIGTQTTGQNLKTINGVTLLGSGNITIGGGGTATDVQVNGTSITSGGVANLVTQSAYNSSTNKIATKSDIPTNTNQLTNGAGFITKSVNNLDNYTKTSSLASVATSGSYNDLSNKPTIPTVNNATLTIQKNGTTVNTFTANASSNVTANITVPTKLSDFETVLYNNASGTQATLNLSDNVSNYSYLEIYYGWNGGNYGIQSTKLDLSKGLAVNLSQTVYNNGYLYFATSKWTAGTTKLTLSGGEYWRIGTSGSASRTQTQQIAVYKVVGYK